MKYKILFIWIAAVGTVFISSRTAADNKKPPIGPLGACTITVYGVPPSCTYITKKACDTATTNVKGTSTWEEGKKCPP